MQDPARFLPQLTYGGMNIPGELTVRCHICTL